MSTVQIQPRKRVLFQIMQVTRLPPGNMELDQVLLCTDQETYLP